MKKLDLYIIKKFLVTYFFSILLIISISIVFDITEKIDDFIEESVPIDEIIFDYYFNFIPYFANLFSSLFVFIAVVFFTSQMASRTEIVAILSSGISFNRILRPYLFAAFIIASLSFVLTGYIIPITNKKKVDFDFKYIMNQEVNSNKNIHMQVSPGIFVYVERFNLESNTGYKFTIEKFDEDKILVSKLTSSYCKWNDELNKWQIYNYFIRDFENGYEVSHTKGNKIDTTIHLFPKNFSTRLHFIETLKNHELDDMIEEHRMRGTEDLLALIVEKYKRHASPFSTFILTIMGLSLASRKTKGGIGLHIGIGITLSFTYILFQQISIMFAIKGNLYPFIAVWIPNLIFLSIAIYLYRIAPK